MSANDVTVPDQGSANTSGIVSTEEEVIRRVGWMMSAADWLYRAAKSSGITREHILLAGSVLALCLLAAGFFAGIRFDRSRADVLDVNGERYQCVGVMRDNSTGIYLPIYKKSSDLLRGQ